MPSFTCEGSVPLRVYDMYASNQNSVCKNWKVKVGRPLLLGNLFLISIFSKMALSRILVTPIQL